ncbi:hypothetical protein BGZ47_008126 [Haplosporangium gracile]|nr:hypothetical protein BGZ47_008126 [Haplosporangium gracile]
MLPSHRALMSSGLDRFRHLCEMAELREERVKAHGSIPEDERDVYFGDDIFGDKATLIQNRDQPLLELLRRNSQLKTFKLAMLPDDPQYVLIELAPLLPQVKRIKLFCCSRRLKPLINIEVIDAFLRDMSSQLQSATLNFTGFCRQDEGTTELLEPLMESDQDKKHPNLKLYRLLDRMDNDLAMALASFLQRCSNNLRMIETKTEPTPHSSDDLGWAGAAPVFRSTVEESTWACAWLVRLNIHIGGISRPDIKFNEAGTPVKAEGEPIDNSIVKEGHTLQRKIYRQLGQLHLLEELFLGYACSLTLNENIGYKTDKAQRNCLEMTMESGLGELRELKCLRVLAVVLMAHRIEAPELDWV